MCFHSSALTVGMTKKGEISSTRTMPRPGKGSLTSSASADAEHHRDDDHASRAAAACSAPTGQKSGSVTKYWKFARPMKSVLARLHQVVVDEREVDRHHQRHDHPEEERDHGRRHQRPGQESVHGGLEAVRRSRARAERPAASQGCVRGRQPSLGEHRARGRAAAGGSTCSSRPSSSRARPRSARSSAPASTVTLPDSAALICWPTAMPIAWNSGIAANCTPTYGRLRQRAVVRVGACRSPSSRRRRTWPPSGTRALA